MFLKFVYNMLFYLNIKSVEVWTDSILLDWEDICCCFKILRFCIILAYMALFFFSKCFWFYYNRNT